VSRPKLFQLLQCRMVYTMLNAPAAFQQMINHIIAGLEDCAAYLDDMVVYSQTLRDHMFQLHNLLKRNKIGCQFDKQ